jgi:2-methylcitrate dehydratase PrpD
MAAALPLARFAAQLSARDLDAAVLGKAKACLLYGLAVGLAAARSHLDDPCGDLLMAVQGAQAPQSATRLLDGAQRPVAQAAFSNAMLLHRRIQEDSHPAGHVGVVVIPSALACAEAARSSGSELLATLVAGYEVALRIARDHVAASSARGFRSTSLYGVFGSAVVATRLLHAGAHADIMMKALAIAANLSSGLRDFVEAGTEEFLIHAGMSAQQGIAAAQLAQSPLTVSTRFLESAGGFFKATGNEDPATATVRLSEDFATRLEFSGVTYKPYPCCQFHRNIVRGMIELRSQSDRDPIDWVEIRMHPFEADFFGVRHKGPFQSFSQTFMSAPFCAASAWLHRGLEYRAMHAFDIPDVLALVERIRIVADARVERYRPILHIAFQTGQTISWHAQSGGDNYLLDWHTATTMTRQLGKEADLDPGALTRLIDTIDSIEDAPNLDPLTEALGALRPVRNPSIRHGDAA